MEFSIKLESRLEKINGEILLRFRTSFFQSNFRSFKFKNKHPGKYKDIINALGKQELS